MKFKIKKLAVVFAVLIPLFLAALLFKNKDNIHDAAQKGDETSTLKASTNSLTVLSYSSFVRSWGPGPEIATLFEKEMKIKINFIEASDAGFLLQKLELFPADVVVGFDQILLYRARTSRQWKSLKPREARWQQPDFVAYDWAPMSLVARKDEIVAPKDLDDLLEARFASQMTLQDPRTSSPGLQFLFWVLGEKGIEDGFKFLEKLKPTIHSISPSWSQAYGMFQKKQAKMTFSYLTSPIYHWVHEKDESYYPIELSNGHPYQVEFAGIPESCIQCGNAEKFLEFILRPDIQKVIMEKNFMLPVVDGVEKGTPFERLPKVKLFESAQMEELIKQQDHLLARWKRLGL